MMRSEDIMRFYSSAGHTTLHYPTLRCWLALMSALLLTAAPDKAASTDETVYQACMERSDGVTTAMLDCLLDAIDDAEARLASASANAIPGLGATDAAALKQSQQDWATFRRSTCNLQARLSSDGSFASVALADCWLHLTQQRLTWLKSMSRKTD